MSVKKIRVLTFSTLFPSSIRPTHAVFVETRLRELLASGQIESRVVAPVPWFFSTHPRFGDYAKIATTPRREVRNGLDVVHPRYALLPKVGMLFAPLVLAFGAVGALRRLRAEGFDFDLIDAHYFYPDGVAAALLSKWFKRPLTITARGSDVNLIGRYRLPKAMMLWAAKRASACIGVSAALVEVLRQWGIDQKKLHVIRNGVDMVRFSLPDGAHGKNPSGLTGSPLLLSVGNLVEHKGHALAIEALSLLLASYPLAKLVVVGSGGELENLKAVSRRLNVFEKTTFVGTLPNEQLHQWYGAAEVLVLASSREGWPNVLLEAMACGTPVVASKVGGTPEIILHPVAGRLVQERSGSSFAAAIESLLNALPSRADVRAYAANYGWQSTTDAQIALFRQVGLAPK